MGLVLVALALSPLATSAQATFDGDITAPGHSTLAMDMLTYSARSTPGSWIWLNPRGYRGFAHDVEVGAGVSYYSNPSGGTSAFQPTVKWRMLRDTSHHLTVSTGAQGLIALAAHADHYGMAFASADLQLHRSPRAAGAVSVGPYVLLDRDGGSADTRHGVIMTAWEAVGSFRLSASWLSGRNFYGYKSASLSYTMASGEWVGLGYSRGNASWHNAGPTLSMGRAF